MTSPAGYPLFCGLTIFGTLVLLRIAIRTETAARNLIASGVCPIGRHGSESWASVACWVLILVVGLTVRFSNSQLSRFAFLVWGIGMLLLCLFSLGWAASAASFFNRSFEIAALATPSVAAGSETNVLLHGADAKNLFVLVSGEKSSGHPEPLPLAFRDQDLSPCQGFLDQRFLLQVIS